MLRERKCGERSILLLPQSMDHHIDIDIDIDIDISVIYMVLILFLYVCDHVNSQSPKLRAALTSNLHANPPHSNLQTSQGTIFKHFSFRHVYCNLTPQVKAG